MQFIIRDTQVLTLLLKADLPLREGGGLGKGANLQYNNLPIVNIQFV